MRFGHQCFTDHASGGTPTPIQMWRHTLSLFMLLTVTVGIATRKPAAYTSSCRSCTHMWSAVGLLARSFLDQGSFVLIFELRQSMSGATCIISNRKHREVVNTHCPVVIASCSELLSLHCPWHPLLLALLPACAGSQGIMRQDCSA